MILANITTYMGQCSDAIHYYCTYKKVLDNYIPQKEEYISNHIELFKILNNQIEIDYLNKKDGYNYNLYKIGSKTNRFSSIEEIHENLKQTFVNQIIVTYYEGKIFKDMLYLINNKNYGYEKFGETFFIYS